MLLNVQHTSIVNLDLLIMVTPHVEDAAFLRTNEELPKYLENYELQDNVDSLFVAAMNRLYSPVDSPFLLDNAPHVSQKIVATG